VWLLRNRLLNSFIQNKVPLLCYICTLFNQNSRPQRTVECELKIFASNYNWSHSLRMPYRLDSCKMHYSKLFKKMCSYVYICSLTESDFLVIRYSILLNSTWYKPIFFIPTPFLHRKRYKKTTMFFLMHKHYGCRFSCISGMRWQTSSKFSVRV